MTRSERRSQRSSAPADRGHEGAGRSPERSENRARGSWRCWMEGLGSGAASSRGFTPRRDDGIAPAQVVVLAVATAEAAFLAIMSVIAGCHTRRRRPGAQRHRVQPASAHPARGRAPRGRPGGAGNRARATLVAVVTAGTAFTTLPGAPTLRLPWSSLHPVRPDLQRLSGSTGLDPDGGVGSVPRHRMPTGPRQPASYWSHGYRRRAQAYP